MKSRLSLGLSSIGASEFRLSPWERVWKIGLFAIVCVLLAMFFAYLTGQVQISTAHATGSDVQRGSTSE
jgi:quinol-cytochrome oxidoreductase complex cytochrome b subunit